jgi:DNA polymerase-1
MTQKLLLIDTSSLLHRAYHAIPYLSADGQPTNAAYGFAGMLLRLRKEEAPDAMALAFDTPKPTFRHQEFAAYKAQRPPTPDALISQIPLVREIAAAFDRPIYEREGYEADDVLGTLAVRAEAAGCQVVLVTGDHDLLQLVTDRIHVLAARQGITAMDRFDLAAVEARWGVRPEQWADLKGLTGDPSDNLPGVPGVGEKTAVQLLQQYGSLEILLERVAEVRNPRVRQALESFADQARLSRRLAVLRTDLPLEFDLAALRRYSLDTRRLEEVFRKYQFTSLLRRLETANVQQRTLF